MSTSLRFIIFFLCFFLKLFAIETIGTKEHPINLAMVPGLDNVILKENGTIIQKFLEKETGLVFNLVVPNSFIAVVESMGTKRIDIALMNTFGYTLAHEKYNAHAALIGTFKGKSEYFGQIIARFDGPKNLAELNGKTFAYVDPASTSGYILAKEALRIENVKLKNSMFAGKHDTVVNLVYQGRVDAGATYHTPSNDGIPQDARTLVKTQYPDVLEKIKILKITGPIPSDPIVFEASFPKNLEIKIVAALKKCIEETKEGKEAFLKTYHLDGLKDASDKDWDQFREVLKKINSNN
jgi:phosphonate transport system substrate-binding protein